MKPRNRFPVGNQINVGNTYRKTHGLRRTPTYEIWATAKQRCFNPNNQRYRLYGARGITMCERWRNSFQAFYEDMGPRPEGMSLDRINNDGNYEPGNCRWATQQQQVDNSRRWKRDAA